VSEGREEGVYVADRDARIVHMDAAGLRILGYDSLDELRGRDTHATLHHTRCGGEPYPRSECPLRAVPRTGVTYATDHDCFFRRDGTMVPVAYTAVPIPVDGATGSAVLFHPTGEAGDVVAHAQESALRLRRSEALHRTLTANLPDTTVFLIDRDLRILAAEGEAVRRLPWFEPSMFRGQLVTELADVPAHVLDLAVEHYRGAFDGVRRTFEFDSEGMTFSIQAVPVFAEDESVETVLVVARDVTAWAVAQASLGRRARQQQAVAELGRFALGARDHTELIDRALATAVHTLDAAGGAILEVDEVRDRLVIASTSGMAGQVRPGDFSSRDPTTTAVGYALKTGAPLVVHDYAAETRFTPFPQFLATGLRSAIVVPFTVHDRQYGALAVNAHAPALYTEDDATFVSAIATLVSVAIERHLDEEATRHAALHDPLTGLPNRALALDRLDQALARRHRDGTDVAVLALDLDRFKNINDSFGHAAGDEVLLELAPRLRASVRPTDTLARLGGDEFVVVCGDADARTAAGVAERLAAAVSRPLELRSGEHFFSVSIGIAVSSNLQDTAESLLRDADAALYRAKDRGRGRYEVFDEAMRSRVMGRLHTERELRRALDRDELVVWYQPVIDLCTGRPVATEALVRWEHPERGLVSPLEFIPVAEETGLIADLGLLVLERACAQTARWQRDGLPLGVSVNVSGRQAVNPAFAVEVAGIARTAGLAPGSLALEITETVLMEEAEAPIAVLHDLRDLGLSLVLDDFGTGYSSLARLKRFPLDTLKVDRAFISGVAADADDRAIVKATIDMAHALGLTVVAEGVETREQEDVLRTLRCDRVQGYLHARPQPPEALTELLSGAAASR